MKTKEKINKINVRCEICGKFIGYKEFSNNEIEIEFIPDTQFTTEEIKYRHKKESNENNKS